MLKVLLFLVSFGLAEVRADESIKNILSVSSGVASPGSSTALGQNPAGLIFNSTTKLSGSLQTANESSSSTGMGIGVFTGSDKVGAGIVTRGYNTHSESPGRIRLLNFGLAANFDPWNTVLGFGASKGLSRSDPIAESDSCQDWCLDLGAIYDAQSDFRLAATLLQISDNTYLVGAGLAHDLSGNTAFVLDAVLHPSRMAAVLKPGFLVYVDGFQMTASYGHRITGSEEVNVRRGWSLGVGTDAVSGVTIEGYFNQFSHYYVGVNLML